MEVKPATNHSLGAVIIGEGLSISQEGILSVDEPSVAEDYIEFTRKRLEELFQESKSRRQ